MFVFILEPGFPLTDRKGVCVRVPAPNRKGEGGEKFTLCWKAVASHVTPPHLVKFSVATTILNGHPCKTRAKDLQGLVTNARLCNGP